MIDGTFTTAVMLSKTPTRLPEGSLENTCTFVIANGSYTPAAIASTLTGIGGYLTSENVTQRRNGLTYFTRVYTELPATKNDKVYRPYTLPGKSGGGRRTWEPYRYGNPQNAVVQMALVKTYTVGLPSTLEKATTFTLPGGGVADYVGAVYDTSEGTPYKFLGLTTPVTIPSTVIADVELVEWRPGLWQKSVYSFSPQSAIGGWQRYVL